MPEDAQHSKDLTAEKAANVIAGLPGYDAVLEFVGDDKRKTVVEAADRRAAELAGLAGDTPNDTSGAIRLGVEGDSRSKSGKPLEEGGSGKVTVRTAYPIDRLEHGVDGVPVITAFGVEVDRSKVGALLEAAASVDTRLEEVEG